MTIINILIFHNLFFVENILKRNKTNLCILVFIEKC